VQDTRPVQPGQLHEIIFSYQLPYQGGASIDQDYPYGAKAVEILMPNDAGLSLIDDSKVVGKGTSHAASFDKSLDTQINPQRPYTRYALQTPLKAGERLIYMLEGGPAVTPAPSGTRGTSNTVGVGAFLVLVLLLLGAVVISTLGVRQFFVRRNRRL
jgi:hypothetical protein